MPMVVIGVLLILAKVAEFGPFANWSWWVIAAPFFIAAAWWQFADSSGLTMKREMAKMDKRQADRRERAIEALGLGTRRAKQASKQHQAKARQLAQMGDPTQAHTTVETRRDRKS